MWGYKTKRVATDMTVVLGVRYKEGFLVSADSLALFVDSEQDGYRVIEVDSDFQKLHVIGPSLLMAIAGSAMTLDNTKLFAGYIRDEVTDKSLVDFKDVVTSAKKYIKLIAPKGSIAELLIVGYGTWGSKKLRGLMIRIDRELAVHKEEDFFSVIGMTKAAQAAAKTIRDSGVALPATLVEDAQQQTKHIFDNCRGQELANIKEFKTHVGDSHIGGCIKQYRVTPEGIEIFEGKLEYPVLVKVGDNLTHMHFQIVNVRTSVS